MVDKMVHDYTIPSIDVARNAFVRNHTWKGTCDTGLLYPIFFDETLPGDTKQLNTTVFGRLATPFVPVLDNIYLDVHYFYCPMRILWDNAKKFFGERKNPNDSIDFMVPTINSGESGFTACGFFDYLGVPPSVPDLTLSSVVFYARAYNKIWNEWYRSEILQDSVEEVTGDTGDTEAKYPLLPRGKRQDYFTSGFTSTQKGSAATVPLIMNSTTAPVYGDGKKLQLQSFDGNNYTRGYLGNYQDYATDAVGNPFNYISGSYVPVRAGTTVPNLTNNLLKTQFTSNVESSDSGAIVTHKQGQINHTGHNSLLGLGISTDPNNSGIIADISGLVSAPTINSLRQAIAIQQFLERDMFSGTRYRELVLSHYGVHIPDYTVQVPEYLGGGTVRVNINPVAQTSSTDSTTPQGNLAATGTVAGSDIGFTHSFDEHGVIIGLASFRTDLTYQQGVDRHFLRNTRYDYFFPSLAHLGMQAVTNKEIYAQGDSVVDSDSAIIDNKVFNYNMRYDEYRFKNSYVTGKFRSSYPQSLDVWHLAENFANLPVFNDEFIKVSDTVNRVVAVQDEPEFLLDVYHDYTDVREVPMYGLPGLTRI